jgi:hypothetical protein
LKATHDVTRIGDHRLASFLSELGRDLLLTVGYGKRRERLGYRLAPPSLVMFGPLDGQE